ncbi:hypothetical protein K435DRAFT_873750 [Dendrothele bispora CBS 962.96]|uniref:Uncharacterized protein n=1 Tax=Dendrothele bispora (strain CBS 962.96) TaxID=1314807 RepID=A0A4S8KYR1_DENBC|nr:hypothetical protein K435DRAFT_873750 [Dendrothele bispora CBS 962.96]
MSSTGAPLQSSANQYLASQMEYAAQQHADNDLSPTPTKAHPSPVTWGPPTHTPAGQTLSSEEEIECRMKAVCEYMTRTHSPEVTRPTLGGLVLAYCESQGGAYNGLVPAARSDGPYSFIREVELEEEDDLAELEFDRLESDGRKIVEENEVLEENHLRALWICCAGQTAIVACLHLEKHGYKVWEEELEREEEEEECFGSAREVGTEPSLNDLFVPLPDLWLVPSEGIRFDECQMAAPIRSPSTFILDSGCSMHMSPNAGSVAGVRFGAGSD